MAMRSPISCEGGRAVARPPPGGFQTPVSQRGPAALDGGAVCRSLLLVGLALGAQSGQDGANGVLAVLGLDPAQGALGIVHDLVDDFLATVGGQAVHEHAVRTGNVHHIPGHLVLRIEHIHVAGAGDFTLIINFIRTPPTLLPPLAGGGPFWSAP